MSETSDNALLLHALDERAKSNNSEFDREVASAIRALEAKVRDDEQTMRSMAARWETTIADRDRLAAEVERLRTELVNLNCRWANDNGELGGRRCGDEARCVRCFADAEVAALRGQLADADAAMKAASSLLAEDRDAYRDEAEDLREDAERLTFVDSVRIEVRCADPIDGVWQVHKLHGSINDMESTCIGEGPTLRAAIDAARRAGAGK